MEFNIDITNLEDKAIINHENVVRVKELITLKINKIEKLILKTNSCEAVRQQKQLKLGIKNTYLEK